jgi:hypothetical protein
LRAVDPDKVEMENPGSVAARYKRTKGMTRLKQNTSGSFSVVDVTTKGFTESGREQPEAADYVGQDEAPGCPSSSHRRRRVGSGETGLASSSNAKHRPCKFHLF